jgi:hypothetical protein
VVREPIVLPARLVAPLRSDLRLVLSEAAERVALVAHYYEGREFHKQLDQELWDFDAARKLLTKLRNASPGRGLGLTLDDHPVLVAELMRKRLEKERQRAEDISTGTTSPDTTLSNDIESFLAHLTELLERSERARREQIRLERHPPTRPRLSHLAVRYREPKSCH